GSAFSWCADVRGSGKSPDPERRTRGNEAANEGLLRQFVPERALSRPRSAERSEGSLDQRASEGTTMGQRLRRPFRSEHCAVANASKARTRADSDMNAGPDACMGRHKSGCFSLPVRSVTPPFSDGLAKCKVPTPGTRYTDYTGGPITNDECGG